MLLYEFDGPKEPKVSQPQLDLLERYLDSLFAAANLDIEFTPHFIKRVNDIRNRRQITIAELRQMFTKAYRKFNKGKSFTNLGDKAQAVLKDMESNVNMPFVIKYDRHEHDFDLVAKTVMRKKGFSTSNKVLAV